MSSSAQAKLIMTIVDQATGPAKAISSAVRSMDDRIKSLSSSIRQTQRQLAGTVAAATAAAAALALPVRSAMQLEDRMADVRKVTNFSDLGLIKFRDDIIELSRWIPMAADALAELAAELAAAGTADAELLRMARLAATAGVAFGVTAQQAGESLGKIRTSLGLTIEQTEEFADQVNALSDATASKAPELLDFAKRVGPLGKQYGYATREVLAFGSAMISAGATPETAATGFQALGRALTRGTAATKGQIRAFQRLGLNHRQVAKRMSVDAMGTTQDVFARIRQLPEWERASTVNSLFGDEAKTAMALIENANLLSSSLQVVNDRTAVAGSVQREFSTRVGTTSGKLQILRNRVTAAGLAVGQALLPMIGRAADALGPYVDRIARSVEANQDLVRGVTLAGSALFGLRIAALSGKLAMLLVGRQALIAARAVTALGVAITGTLARAALGAWTGLAASLVAARRAMLGFAVASSIVGSRAALGLVFGSIGRAALLLVNPLRWAAAAVGLLSVALRGLRVALLASGVGALLVGVGLAAAFIVRNWRGIVSATEAFGAAFKAALGPVEPMLRPVISAVSTAWDWFKKLTGEVDASGEKWKAWGTAAGTAVGEAVKATVEFVQRFAAWPGEVAASIRSATGQLAAAGEDMIQSLWDGAVAKFNQFIEWVKTLPGKIIAAIGRIDLSNIIKWPSLPSFGRASAPADAPPAASAPAVDGARASGGPVLAGKTYLVGEEGPELFSPGASGFITPHSTLRASLAGDSPSPVSGHQKAAHTRSQTSAASGNGHHAAGHTTNAPRTDTVRHVESSVTGPTIHAPVTVTLTFAEAGGMKPKDVADAVRRGIADAFGQLDAQLRRSTQVAFASARYGDA